MRLKNFSGVDEALAFVVLEIADALRVDIAKRGRALLILTGGATIRPFLKALTRADIDWQYVTVVLSDERWVPVDDPMSNEKQLREFLLDKLDIIPRYISLKVDSDQPSDGVPVVSERLQPLLPVSAALLSVGDDGHVASLFPTEPEIWHGKSDIAIATSSRNGRISLGPDILYQAKHKLLLLRKPRTLDQKKIMYLQKIFREDAQIVNF